ncbi:MAG: fumarylacetoacetate hydrolase family protein, partial [Burkholderiaceae bacterium]
PPPNLDTSRNSERGGLSVQLEIRLQTAKAREQGQPPALLGSSNLMDCYWSIGQLVAHHTTNGCALERGELIGTGTVSGPESGQCGCMYELTAGGKAPVELPTGERRGFVGDGDSLSVSAFCEAAGFRRIGFGVAKATVLPGR